MPLLSSSFPSAATGLKWAASMSASKLISPYVNVISCAEKTNFFFWQPISSFHQWSAEEDLLQLPPYLLNSSDELVTIDL